MHPVEITKNTNFFNAISVIAPHWLRETPFGKVEVSTPIPAPGEANMSDMQIDFDRDGWTVTVSANGRMQISGRTPRSTPQVLFDIVEIEEPMKPGEPTVAMNIHGQRLELVKVD